MELTSQKKQKVFSNSRMRLAEVINACYPQFKDKLYAVELIFKTQGLSINVPLDIIFDRVARQLLREFKPRNIMPLVIEQANKIMPILEDMPIFYQDAIQKIEKKVMEERCRNRNYQFARFATGQCI